MNEYDDNGNIATDQMSGEGQPSDPKKGRVTKPRVSIHTSRAQDSRSVTPLHEDQPVFLEDFGPLPNVPPRPGYTQRWIATQSASGVNGRNISRAYQRGWVPRMADTVPKAFQSMVVQREGMGGVIGTHDMVLFERSEKITNQVEKLNRDKVKNLELAVSQSMYREHEKLREESRGFAPGRFESQSRVERGRMPISADED